MVMEASPSPQSVGREFVRQYYTLLNKAPAHLHRFYNNYSSFVHGGLDAPNRETLPVVGQKQIHNRIQQLDFRDCHAKISQVDAQATLGNGVVVQVTGELSNGGAPMRRFTQTFVLAAQSPKMYYVHNDIFRYQDIVFSDEEGEASGRSEGEEDEVSSANTGDGRGGYFPPPPAAFAPAPPPTPACTGAAFPVPPIAPLAPLASPPATPSGPLINGHPAPLDDARHLVAALHATTLSGPVNECEVEPEPTLVAVVSPITAVTPVAAAAPISAITPIAVVAPVPIASSAPPSPPSSVTPAEIVESTQEPEPSREPSPLPVPPAPPTSSEPKTYANLLKSGGGGAVSVGNNVVVSGPVVPAPVVVHAGVTSSTPTTQAPLEQRSRSQRVSRDTQPPPADNQSQGSAQARGRYSDSQQLFLGNLPHSATEEELRALFARYGPVAELRVHSKPAAPGAPRHPNYGFITYETSQAAHDCLNAAPLYFPADSTDGVKLNVEEKKTRGREPPRRRPVSSHRAPFQQRERPAYRR